MHKRHVTSQWQLLYLPEQKRYSTLCNSKASSSTIGIPGITPEARGRWCRRCIFMFNSEISQWRKANHNAPVGLRYFYDVLEAEGLRCLGKAEGDLPEPLYSRFNRSFNNRVYVIWSVMMDRCYDPSNPQWAGWGSAGITVDPYWHDFTAFALDAPEDINNFNGVFPGKGSKVIERDTARWV